MMTLFGLEHLQRPGPAVRTAVDSYFDVHPEPAQHILHALLRESVGLHFAEPRYVGLSQSRALCSLHLSPPASAYLGVDGMGEVGMYKQLVRILNAKIGEHVFAATLERYVFGLALILLPHVFHVLS